MGVAVQEDDVVEMRVWTSDAEQAAVNTHYLLVNSTTGGDVLDTDFANQQSTLLAPILKAMLPSVATYDGVQAKVLRSSAKFAAASSVIGAGPGTNGGVGMARQAAGLLSWTTRFSGPGARGRTFWPFPSASSNAGDGEPISDYINSLLTYGAAWLTTTLMINGIASAGVTFVLFHRATKAPHPVTPQSTLPITSYIARGHWATMKKRGSYGRGNLSPL